MYIWIVCTISIVLVWVIAITVFFFYKNPLPFPDRGHRCFAVPSEQAAKVVTTILGNLGLPERFTFDAGHTHQTLLWDNTTVIIRHDEDVREPNGFSIVVKNPKVSALETLAILKRAGFTATIKDDVVPEVGDKLVLLTSDAFDGWALIFRRHILSMGNPLNKRKLLK